MRTHFTNCFSRKKCYDVQSCNPKSQWYIWRPLCAHFYADRDASCRQPKQSQWSLAIAAPTWRIETTPHKSHPTKSGRRSCPKEGEILRRSTLNMFQMGCPHIEQRSHAFEQFEHLTTTHEDVFETGSPQPSKPRKDAQLQTCFEWGVPILNKGHKPLSTLSI